MSSRRTASQPGCPQRTEMMRSRRAVWGKRRNIPAAVVAVCCLISRPASSTRAGFLTERDILTILYNSCGGDDWKESANWLDDTESVCHWHGISCQRVEITSRDENDEDDAPLSVVAVELLRNNLRCTLPPEVFYLSHLRTLDLGGNKALDANFNEIGVAAGFELEYLRLNDAGLTSLSGVSRAAGRNLKSLDVRGNDLTGEFPAEVFKYRKLRNLDLSYNFFSGTLPEDLGSNLFKLRSLLLSNNFFTGEIPTSVGSMTKMETMDLSENSLTGMLPTELGDLERMTILSIRNQRLDAADLNDTGITGPLFDFAKLRKIDYLDLAGNGLTGTVPNSFLESADTMSVFLSVDMSGNNLVGTLPPSLSRFSVLRLYLIDNSIEDIAPELCTQADWFFGEVGEFGCNAILCSPGTFNTWGRQISDRDPCEVCPEGAPTYGSTHCQPPQTKAASESEAEFESESESTQELPQTKAASKSESEAEFEFKSEPTQELLVYSPEFTHDQAIEPESSEAIEVNNSESNSNDFLSRKKTAKYKPFANAGVRSVDIGQRMKSIHKSENAGMKASLSENGGTKASLSYSGAVAALCVQVVLHLFYYY